MTCGWLMMSSVHIYDNWWKLLYIFTTFLNFYESKEAHRVLKVHENTQALNWMTLRTNGLLRTHLQCTIRLSTLLYPPRTLCVCKYVCALMCVRVSEKNRVSRVFYCPPLLQSLWVVSLKGSTMVTFDLVQPSFIEDKAIWIQGSNVECIHC